jgi:hypothetical protein
MAERFADAAADATAPFDELMAALRAGNREDPGWLVLKALTAAFMPRPDRKEKAGILALQVAVLAALRAAGPWGYDEADGQRKKTAERHAQAQLLRDIFNPFRAAAAFDPTWLDWQPGSAPHLARRIYEERRRDDMPLCAEALQRASGADANLLAHCRGPGPHVQNCWVVDLILKRLWPPTLPLMVGYVRRT